MDIKKICLLIPSLSAGGAERVMSVLANEFSKQENIQVHLVVYVKPDIFYDLSENVIIHKINFDYKRLPRLIFTVKIFLFIRKVLKEIRPESFLSFGGKYNSLVLLASLGLGIKGFVSDRSRPGIKYGFIPDLMNPFIYRRAYGILAQTKAAKEHVFSKTKHKNIVVIPNPILTFDHLPIQRENIILNVGRFISSKNQNFLIEVFNEINPPDWRLWFVGDGDLLKSCKEKAESLQIAEKVQFFGNIKDVRPLYERSSVFAFCSISEGFPNALAEALSNGLASISFDCTAGPSDLIDHEVNGFLVENMNKEYYKKYLGKLILDQDLRERFGNSARDKMKEFNDERVCQAYIDFLLS